MTNHKVTLSHIVFVTVTSAFLLSVLPVSAQESGVGDTETLQTNPKERLVDVTATVPDNIAPSAPVLIAPSNGSLHRGTPVFSWFAASDNISIDHYTLTMDGTVLYSFIPTYDSNLSEFALTYSAQTQQYELFPKNSLPDGNHTWKVTAVDARANATDSTTWSFTLDTLAPVFVITTIDELSTAISAQDLATLPSEPLTLTNNEPILTGTGESNAQVVLTYTWEGATPVTQNFTIDADGNWSTQFPLIPRDTVITLTFLITDTAGNVSILENVAVLLPSTVVTIPGQPDVTVSLPGSPKELIASLGETVHTLLPTDLQVLTVVTEPIATVVNRTYEPLEPIATIVILASVPVLAVVSLVAPFGTAASTQTVSQALYAIGYLPYKKRQGIVFETSDQTAVGLATVILTGETVDGEAIHSTAITTVDGFYPPFNPGFGRYRVSVARQNCTFPSLEKRPLHVSQTNYYQGEEFVIDADHPEPGLLIPVDRVAPDKITQFSATQLLLSKLSQYREVFGMLSWSVVAVVTAVSPTWMNVITLTSFSSILMLRYIIFTSSITGVTETTEHTPVKNVILKATNIETGVVETLTQSHSHGQFSLSKIDHEYELTVVDAGRKWNPQWDTHSSKNRQLHITLSEV